MRVEPVVATAVSSAEATGVASRSRLRVCLINSIPDWGGGERLFLELAVGLQSAGHSVTLVCRPESALAARAAHISRVEKMRCAGYFDVTTLRALRRCFLATRFDAAFCNTGRDCFLAGLAACGTDTPVVRIRQLVRTRRTLHSLFVHRVLLSAVVSVSRAAQDGLTELRIPASRSFVIHNGIELQPNTMDRAAARRSFQLSDESFVVAFIGRLAKEKGADLLPAIASRLRGRGVPLRLLIAGDGALKTEIQEQCRGADLAHVVRLLGFQEDTRPLLAAADAAVVASRAESFGIAAVEALAAGVPLVATAVGGLSEIVTDGESGLLVCSDDVDALAGALERLYRDPAFAARLRERGLIRAQDFSRTRMIARYEEVIRTLQRNRGT